MSRTAKQSPAPVAVLETFAQMARRTGTRGRLTLAFGAVLVLSVALAVPAIWHGIVRVSLARRAAACGYELTVGGVTGGPFGATRIDHLRLQAFSPGSGTDLSISQADIALDWHLPFVHRSTSWLKDVRIVGVDGLFDLTPGAPADRALRQELKGLAVRWIPERFSFEAANLRLRHGIDLVDFTGLRLTGRPDGPGSLDWHGLMVNGAGAQAKIEEIHGRTGWKNGRLTLDGLDLGHNVWLNGATLDFSQLGRRRVNFDGSFRALGGDIRAQTVVDFSTPQLAVDFAVTLHQTDLAPVAEVLGIRAPVDGRIDQGSFTFRGDPGDLAAAQMWVAVKTTDFSLGARHWQSLEARAVVVHRRLQLHQLDLRQAGNRLSLSGEFPLPLADFAGLDWIGESAWWKAPGFACRVDAQLEDLGGLAELLGWKPLELAGRMSMNGELKAIAGHSEINGYMTVEGTRLSLRAAPLDYLRSTLIFRRNTLEIADVQATHDTDYLTAHGTIDLAATPVAVNGEVRSEIKDMSVYMPVLLGLPGLGNRAATVRNLSAVLRVENGEVTFDRWDGEMAGNLLARP